jgi:hypothetical protein
MTTRPSFTIKTNKKKKNTTHLSTKMFTLVIELHIYRLKKTI